MERAETSPRLVEVDVLAEVADLLDDLAGVVDGAVVGALLDDRRADRALALGRTAGLDERVRPDLRADAPFVERRPVDRPHHAEGVAIRLEVDRDRARDHQRPLVVRLVVVAVEKDDVAVAQQSAVDGLVRARGAVEDEVGAVGAEDRGHLLLGRHRRPFANEAVSQGYHRVADLVPPYVLATFLY